MSTVHNIMYMYSWGSPNSMHPYIVKNDTLILIDITQKIKGAFEGAEGVIGAFSSFSYQ